MTNDELHEAALELVAAMVEKHNAETRYYAAVRALIALTADDQPSHTH